MLASYLLTCSGGTWLSSDGCSPGRVPSLYMMIEGILHSIFLNASINTTEQLEIRAATVQSIAMAQ